MYTYTMQAARPSGETFVIEWDGETIHATCGPLTGADRDAAITDPSSLPGWQYETGEDGGFVGHDDWGYPVVTYDPNTGEVYRDMQAATVIEAMA